MGGRAGGLEASAPRQDRTGENLIACPRVGAEVKKSQQRADPLPPRPSFLIIGAQKGATRWFRLNLGRHPEIFTADEELSFFNTKRYELGLDHYRRLFEGWNGERVLGEATPGYMIWRHDPETVAERIHRDLPNARLFAVLRNPVDRLYSAFIHHVRRGRIDPDENIIDRVRQVPPEQDQLQLVAGGWYARSLTPYMRLFGSQLTVILSEDARADPRAVYAAALGQLDVDSSFVPEKLEEVVFSRSLPKNTRYWQPGNGRRDLTEEERLALAEYFAGDIDQLERMLGRDLSAWRQS